MTTELEAILDSNLVTTVFLYGSAAMLVVSMIFVTWLESGSSHDTLRAPVGAKVLS
jgi:hypothetical protein